MKLHTRSRTVVYMLRDAMRLGGIVATMLVFAHAALAVTPVPDAKYVGHVRSDSSTSITFGVSKDGRFVIDARVSPVPPNTCDFRGTTPSQSSPKARIRNGRFVAAVIYRVSGKVVATAKLTATFTKRGTGVTGLIDSTVLISPSSCGGYYTFSATKS